MLRTLPFAVLTIAAFSLPSAAQDDETISRILSCAGNIGIELDLEITSGLENILTDSADEFEGSGDAQITNSFIELFPSEDRLEAMRLWTACVQEHVRQSVLRDPDTEAGCIVLNSMVASPIPLRTGACFMPRDAISVAHVRRVFRTGVEFDGGADGPFTCYTDQLCSFGWSGAPTFRVTRISGQSYMIGG